MVFGDQWQGKKTSEWVSQPLHYPVITTIRGFENATIGRSSI